MNASIDLLAKVENYVSNLLTFHLSDKLVYHNLGRTRTVVHGAVLIANQAKLGKDKSMVLQLATWFQDTGYLGQLENHRGLSVKIATNYLKINKIDRSVIKQVCDCIMATKKAEALDGNLHAIIKDANLFEMSQSNYWNINAQLRKEMALVQGKRYDHYEWYVRNLALLEKTSFETDYGRTVLENKRQWLVLENERIIDTIRKRENGINMDSPALFPSRGHYKVLRFAPHAVIRI